MKPTLEVADVFREYGPAYRQTYRLSKDQLKGMQAIERCRTSSLGGHIDACKKCGTMQISYNSCRNRHCPKCQAIARERWLQARKGELLPVPYFHVVFTLPHDLNPVIRCNEAVGYRLLFQAASQTVRELSEDKKYLGALPGMMSILHTWGQNLMYHPHIHCIIPSGGLCKDGSWKSGRDNFFLPVRVVSRLFRGKFLSLLKQRHQQGKLNFFGKAAYLGKAKTFNSLLGKLYQQDWVVYAKKPFGGPEQVLSYLGRYTHRVAIGNHRLIKMEEGHVYFRWKDYKQQGEQKIMRLSAEEFIRRFLTHILPSGFCKIRYTGFLATRGRKQRVKHIRRILKCKSKELQKRSWQEWLYELTGVMPGYCPSCKDEVLVTLRVFPAAREPPVHHFMK